MTQRNELTSAFAAFDAMEVSLSASNYDDARKMKELDKENNDPLLVKYILPLIIHSLSKFYDFRNEIKMFFFPSL